MPGFGYTRPAASLPARKSFRCCPTWRALPKSGPATDAALHASAEFLHQHFLVIGLDEGVAGASGCSIDASVRFVAQLEQRLQVSLLDKSQLAFLHDGRVQLLKRSELKAGHRKRNNSARHVLFRQHASH